MKKIIGFLFCTLFVGAVHSQDGHLVTPANAKFPLRNYRLLTGRLICNFTTNGS
ncbi:MAG: hypothetical protein IPP43_05915 [Chitinophagaceae bacterium]|nr:hypothetical protein [Chitinophagaceae bacterium]